MALSFAIPEAVYYTTLLYTLWCTTCFQTFGTQWLNLTACCDILQAKECHKDNCKEYMRRHSVDVKVICFQYGINLLVLNFYELLSHEVFYSEGIESLIVVP